MHSLKGFLLDLLPEPILRAVKKRHYSRKLRHLTPADEKDLAVLPFLVQPGDRVADIGANFGAYTKCLADLVGPSGHVCSIEPVPLTFEVLSFAVRTLGLRNVELLSCAVSDHSGPRTMEVPRYGAGGENYYEARIVEGPGSPGLRRVLVGARTLDELLAGGRQPVAFVKLDVEGHELACLRGATRLLGTCRPAWLIEVSGDPEEAGSPAREVFDLFAGRGYRPFWFDGSALRTRRIGDRSTNYFFLTEAQSDAAGRRGLRIPAAGA